MSVLEEINTDTLVFLQVTTGHPTVYTIVYSLHPTVYTIVYSLQSTVYTPYSLQVHKRVWPTAQRDAVFWSHMRKVEVTPEEAKQVTSYTWGQLYVWSVIHGTSYTCGQLTCACGQLYLGQVIHGASYTCGQLYMGPVILVASYT